MSVLCVRMHVCMCVYGIVARAWMRYARGMRLFLLMLRAGLGNAA